MVYTLSNEFLSASFDTLGAELISVRGKDGCEYIWQGDPKYWKSHSPIMFPICGRLPDGHFSYEGKSYAMTHHGFTRTSEFELFSSSKNELSFLLVSNEAIKTSYPFDFEFKVTYTLDGNNIKMSAEMKNTGNSAMPATFGAHPGFNVPLSGNSRFEDWYIEFGEECTPNMLVFSESLLDSGKRVAYPLEDNKILRLSHELFLIDGVFMTHIAPSVTLKSDIDSHFVKLTYPQMPYIGVWHMPQTDAPYVCLEPWCSLPSIDGMPDDIMKKNAMFHILPKKVKCVDLTFEFGTSKI